MMRFFFVGVALLVSTSLFGGDFAIDQGSIKLGGSADFDITYTPGTDALISLGGILNPHIGYFVQKGLCVGGSIIPLCRRGLNYSYMEIGITVSPEVRYYFGENDQQMYPFVGLIPSFGFLRSQYSSPINTYSCKLTLLAGAAYMLHKNIALEPAVCVTYQRDWRRNSYRFSSTLVILAVTVAITTFWF